MQTFSNSVSESALSFDVMKTESNNIGSLSGLLSADLESQHSSGNTKTHLSSNGLDVLSSGGTSGHGSATLTPSPRPLGGSDDFGVNLSSCISSQSSIDTHNNFGSFISDEDTLKRQNLLLAQQLTAGFTSNSSGLPHNVQLQLALQAALSAGGMPFSNGFGFGNEKLLDLSMGVAGNQVQRNQLSPHSNNSVTNDMKFFSESLQNNCSLGRSNIHTREDDSKLMSSNGPWAAQPEDLFAGFNNNSNSKRAITGQHGYLQPSGGPQVFSTPIGSYNNRVTTCSSFSQLQQIPSKMSSAWNSSLSNGKNWSPQNAGVASSCTTGNSSNSNGHMNPWSQALQYQRLGLGHTPMNAFPNMSKGNSSNNSFSCSGPSNLLSSGACGNNNNAASSMGMFTGNNRYSHDRMKRNLPTSSYAPSTQSNNITNSFFKMDSHHSSTSDMVDWHSLSSMLPTSCNNDLSGNCGVKTQSSLDSMRCLENPLLDIMKSNSVGASGMSELHAAGLLDDSNLATLDPALSGLVQTHNLSMDLFGMGCEERYSRKVFVGGLPPDIDEDEITAAFRRFGNLIVDWPHKQESKTFFPPKGYCFLLFQDEISVQSLIDACIMDESKHYWCVSSPTMKDKPVQIRPWNLNDSDYVHDSSQPLDPRKTIFVGGVPRPLRAVELAMIMDRLYGGVCYAGIDTDPELKYPKGAGRVAFSNQQSYIAAISARFVQLQHCDIDKRVEVKPYVLDDQMCDECNGSRCAGKFAPFFCANVTCLQYYCEQCWAHIHSRPGREYHKPLVKEGADRPRTVPFRW